MGLNAPLVAEDSIAVVLVSQNPLEAAKNVSTVEREQRLEYENCVSISFAMKTANH